MIGKFPKMSHSLKSSRLYLAESTFFGRFGARIIFEKEILNHNHSQTTIIPTIPDSRFISIIAFIVIGGCCEERRSEEKSWPKTALTFLQELEVR